MTSCSCKQCLLSSFEWTPVPDHDNEPLPLPDICVWHMHLNLDSAGPSTSHTTYISAPASPSKCVEPLFDDNYNNYNWNPGPPPSEINIENYPFLDLTYQHHLDLIEPGPPQRKRIVEVIFSCYTAHTLTNGSQMLEQPTLEMER